MKIKNLSVRNYKRFVTSREFNFCDENGEPNDVILIIGNNGSGKTSILQAIAALIGSATKPHFSPADLDWLGYDYSYIQSGRMPIMMKASIAFSELERRATTEYAKQLADFSSRNIGRPSQLPEIDIHLEYDLRKVKARTLANFYQLSGYQYALQLKPFVPNFSQLFERVGSIYWYNEQRTSTSVLPFPIEKEMENSNSNGNGKIKFENKDLRELLSRLYRFHERLEKGTYQLREGQMDYYARLSDSYTRIFRQRKFEGPSPKMDIAKIFEEEDFWLSDGQTNYEINGMSAGERAIFPILLDFASWNINNSIILIDEIELHLHPPLQQEFLRALPLLGSNNQFIITSHSDDIVSTFPNSQIIRL